MAESAAVAPEELADCDDPVNFAIAYGAAVANADRQSHSTVISENVVREFVFDRVKKRFDFLRNFADSKHTVPLFISIDQHNTYWHSALFLFNHIYHQNSFNRSV